MAVLGKSRPSRGLGASAVGAALPLDSASILSRVLLRTHLFLSSSSSFLKEAAGVGDLNPTPRRRVAHLIIKVVIITNTMCVLNVIIY